MSGQGKNYKRLFIIISVLVPVVVAVLMYLPKGNTGESGTWVYALPFYNAIINTLTSILLVLGYVFIKNGKEEWHKANMITAFVLGAFFLVFYIIYHSSVESTPFGGEGAIRLVYYFFLITHILLAFAVVPLVLSAIYFAVARKLPQHRKVVKFTFPVWLYVSVTGVIVYLMISPYYPS